MERQLPARKGKDLLENQEVTNVLIPNNTQIYCNYKELVNGGINNFW